MYARAEGDGRGRGSAAHEVVGQGPAPAAYLACKVATPDVAGREQRRRRAS